MTSRLKGDPADLYQIAAPMPGMVASIAVSIGHKVSEGDALMTLEAMKMFTTVTAPCDGTVQEILVEVVNTLESKDLMIKLVK